MRFKAGVAGLTAVVMAALAGCGAQAAGDPEGTERVAPSSTVPPSTAPARENVRLPSAELQGRWWTWAASEPDATNPVADTDGSACGRNQPHDVWFLAGTFGGQVKRACEVPSGRPIAAPVVNTFGDPQNCEAFMSSAQGPCSSTARWSSRRPTEASRSRCKEPKATRSPGRKGALRLQDAACGCSCHPSLPGSTP